MKKKLLVSVLLCSLVYANEINLNTNYQTKDEIKLTGTVVSDGQQMIGSRFMGYIKKYLSRLVIR